MDLCRELMAPAWIAVGLQNDLWSWPKERDAAEKQGRGHVINALWVLMQEHKTDVDGAEQICRRLIKENVAKYLQVVRASKDNDSLSKDLRKYINAMQYSISGNVVWSLSCPRYNPDISFNKQQLEWMYHGVPASDDSRGPASSVGSPVSEQSAGSNQSRSTAGNLLLLSDPRTPKPSTVGIINSKTPSASRSVYFFSLLLFYFLGWVQGSGRGILAEMVHYRERCSKLL